MSGLSGGKNDEEKDRERKQLGEEKRDEEDGSVKRFPESQLEKEKEEVEAEEEESEEHYGPDHSLSHERGSERSERGSERSERGSE